jgi:uncharacterized sulfatase
MENQVIAKSAQGKVAYKAVETIVACVLSVWLFSSVCWAIESEATSLLKARNSEFRQEVIKVTDGVHTAVGYSVSPVSMIVGSDGIVIIDTGMDAVSAERVMADFRKITDKPVKAVIFTHGHGDHTGGAGVFAAAGNPQIWARSNFGSEGRAMKQAGLTIQNVRGARQGGFKLPPEKRINNGVARAYWPKRGGSVFHASERVAPTHTFTEPRKKFAIAGTDIELVAVNGETSDALYVWLPKKRVLFAGDNFYKSWPNLYAIRGTMYRDVCQWADTMDKMLNEEPNYLVPGHTRPIVGKEKIREVLTDYRDAIRFVFEKTVEGMNKGYTPDELVNYVKLPAHLSDKDYLREYYGNIQWAVRQIFNAYLGWFDGNPTNLFPLSPQEQSRRIADLAGGRDVLLRRAAKALAEKDYQWAARLSDYLLFLDPKAKEPKLIKADALESMAQDLLTATGRNYYLTIAQELRAEARMGTVSVQRKGEVHL